jgi:hypothetical protein
MAGECPDALSPQDLGDHSYFAYLEVDDLDQLYEAVIAKGVTVVKKLRNEPWAMGEFGIRTVDGHRIMFACPAEGAVEQTAIADRLEAGAERQGARKRDRNWKGSPRRDGKPPSDML